MLIWWLELLQRHGVREVLVNTHYRADLVHSCIGQYNDSHSGLQAYAAYEPELLGSGGMIFGNRDFMQGEEHFLICYCDNLTDIDLTDMVDFHRAGEYLMTVGLFHAPSPRECGIAALDEKGVIIDFVEKPERPRSDLANAGIYVASNQLFDLELPRRVFDIGSDLLPQLCGRMRGYAIQGYFTDIGSPDRYKRACDEWAYDHL